MRRRFRRRISKKLSDRFFKPAGIPMRNLEIVEVSKEELETIRLRYLEKKDQIDAAKSMGISQSQYQRDITNTLSRITDAMVNGKAVRISGSGKEE